MICWSRSLHGWEFSLHGCDCGSDCRGWWCEVLSKHNLKKEGAKKPKTTLDHVFSITHLGSGLQFRFQACDALRKWSWEKFNCDEGSCLPTYGSPLRPAGLDSAYVGSLLIPRIPGETPWKFNSAWDDIDWGTLHKQIVWTNMHDKISGWPDADCLYENPESKAGKRPNRKRRGRKFEGKALLKPLVNWMLHLYTRIPFWRPGDTVCSIYLVLTESGWFFWLRQSFSGFGVRRTRGMTMHCRFAEDIIYREIIERQSKDFHEGLHEVSKWSEEYRFCEVDDGMHLHFHEVKQLVVKGAFERALYGSFMVHDAARRYSSFVRGELYGKMDGKILEKLDVSDRQVELLFSNSGEQIELIGKKTGTCIQIVPLFRHPQDPKYNKIRREAYIYGLSKYNVSCAKSRIADLLKGMEFERTWKTKAERKAERRAAERIPIGGSLSRMPSMDELLVNIGAILGEA